MIFSKAKNGQSLFLVLLCIVLVFIFASYLLLNEARLSPAVYFLTCVPPFAISLLFFSRQQRYSRQKREHSQLFNSSVDCIIVCDNAGKILEFNPQAEKDFGYTADEIRGKEVRLLYASAEDYTAAFERIDKAGRFRGEVLNKRKNGEVFTSFLSANPIYDEKKNVSGTMGISRNISAQKKMEDEFLHIVNNASEIIYTSDVEGNFVFINPSVQSIMGYTAEELKGKSFRELIPAEQLGQVQEYYKTHFKSKRSESYFEFQAIRKDGKKIWIGQNIRTVFEPGDQSRINGFQCIARDITDRKEIELKLAASEKNYRELFDNSSDLIHSIDASGRFLYVNDTWKKTLGYTDEDIRHTVLFDIIHPGSREHCKTIFEEILRTGRAVETRPRYHILAKDGSKRLVESSLNVTRENGQIVSIQAFLRDITKQEETENLLLKSEINFRQIAETIKDVFYLYNIVDHKYEYISPNCEVVLGADQEFFYSGKSHTELFAHPADKERLRAANKDVDTGKEYEIEYRLLIDGKIRWINERSFPIRDADGNVVSNSGICIDITSIKTAMETIHAQNTEIGKSIVYAKSIQDSALPSAREMNALLPESFVLYMPKDVLSGDFYIVDTIQGKNKIPFTTFIVADCTGHGVPGGILSLLCNSLTRDSFNNHNVHSPAEALEFVRTKLVKFFRSNQLRRVQDGMDISFCLLNEARTELLFAGANSSCIVISDGVVTEYTGDRQHVGYNVLEQPFTNYTIEVQKGDCIYLFTDGYIHQFGGPLDKKYTKKKLKDLLLSIHQEPMLRQYEILDGEFFIWKGQNEQTDDVTLMGIRI